MVKITPKGKKAWVTFTIAPQDAQSVSICGEWNEWADEPMKKKKSGEFYIRKSLELGSEYQFGYRVNETQWHCDDELGCVPSPFGSQNSLLKL
jgi:1,4-alpha-glucan branching enzyme